MMLLLPLCIMGRDVQSLDKGWQFVLSEATIDELDGVEGWRTVDVPHDWSIEGPQGPKSISSLV